MPLAEPALDRFGQVRGPGPWTCPKQTGVGGRRAMAGGAMAGAATVPPSDHRPTGSGRPEPHGRTAAPAGLQCRRPVAGSSNGRTPGSGPGSWGSNPCPAEAPRGKQPFPPCAPPPQSLRASAVAARLRRSPVRLTPRELGHRRGACAGRVRAEHAARSRLRQASFRGPRRAPHGTKRRPWRAQRSRPALPARPAAPSPPGRIRAALGLEAPAAWRAAPRRIDPLASSPSHRTAQPTDFFPRAAHEASGGSGRSGSRSSRPAGRAPRRSSGSSRRG